MNVSVNLTDNQYRVFAALDYEITPDSFKNGKLFIVCEARVFDLYKRTAEVLLTEERPRLEPVTGTRESSQIGKYAIFLLHRYL